ncbi:hypothetical protein, variant [Aphanomyces astaci]|nr:hypothetical protein, variant [Aphanomyces astaci]ETV89173.1 hypothetical protein, variant [Aphanomyces astaci]|eukprot:XP_009821573.1 hypothetical protein, variant [Aphanomyces astaci]
MDTKDVVFATQQAGFLALLHLAQQYPQHVNVASHVAAAIVRIMQRHRQSPEQGRSGEGSSSDDDDDVCEPGAMHNPDVVSDLVNVMLKRMESFAGDVNMQRWGLRAVSCILLHEHGKSPDAAFQGLAGTTSTYVHLVLRAMAKMCANASVALWGSQQLTQLFTNHRQFISVMAERGGIEVCVDVMRTHTDNWLIQRWAGQVVLLCAFWDVRLQEAAKGEGLLHQCNSVLCAVSDESDADNNPMVDILLCLRLVMENVGKIHATNSDLLVSRYDDGTVASIISTDIIPNSLGGKVRHQAAITITRFFRFIVSSRRMDAGGGSSLLAVLKRVLAKQGDGAAVYDLGDDC